MSNISSLLRSHCLWPFTPYRWQIRYRANEIKMIVCWQEQVDSSFHPHRQQPWHHIFSKWHINEFSNTWTFLAEDTFDTSRFFRVSNNRILYHFPHSRVDGGITFWALTSWQGFILLPLLMTSSLQVNWRCNDSLFCLGGFPKCHWET
jgi:hypothetical protein